MSPTFLFPSRVPGPRTLLRLLPSGPPDRAELSSPDPGQERVHQAVLQLRRGGIGAGAAVCLVPPGALVAPALPGGVFLLGGRRRRRRSSFSVLLSALLTLLVLVAFLVVLWEE